MAITKQSPATITGADGSTRPTKPLDMSVFDTAQVPVSDTPGAFALRSIAPAQTNIEPVTSATDLVAPQAPVQVPPPVVAPVPDMTMVQSVTDNTNEIITAQTEEAKRLNELRSEYAALGEQASQQEMFTQGIQDLGVPENVRRQRDVQLQLNKLAEQSGLAQVGIAGAAGQTVGQAGREITQEQREASVRSSALAAEASILQGNIETATSLVGQSVDFAYRDQMTRNENMINQINAFQGVVDDQTAQLLTQEARRYEKENFDMQQAVSSVNSAVATGFASQEDVATMTALSGDPKAQKEFADKILAKASRTQYMNALAATHAASARAAAEAGDEVKGAAAAKAVSAQSALDVLQVIKNNPLGIKAIAGSNFLGRTALSAAGEAITKGFIGGTGAGALGGSVLPGAGTVAGGALGGVTGAVAGAGAGTFQASKQRADVASALGYLVNSGTFSEMRRLREGGVTFGSLTEGERIAIGKAADALFSALAVADDGAVTGVKSSEENFNRLLTEFETKQKDYLREANAMASGLTREDYDRINED